MRDEATGGALPSIRVGRSAGALMLVSALTKPVSFLREAIAAALFGTSVERDAFLVAWTLPNLIGSLVTEGLAAVLVPLMVGYLAEGRKDEMERAATNLFNALALALAGLSLFIALASPLLVSCLAPGLTPQARALAAGLARPMALCVLFMGLAAFLNGLLNAQGSFVLPALTTIVLNLVVIGAMLVGRSIWSLAWGMAAGTAGMALWQLPPLWRRGWRYRLHLEPGHEALGRFGRLAGPLFVGTAVMNLSILVDRMVASALPTGSIAALDYASRLIQLAFTLFVPTVVTPFLPLWSLASARGDRSGFARSVMEGVRAVEFLVIPAALWLALLGEPTVALLFERGAFDQTSTGLTAQALAFYAPGLALAAYWVLFHAFYTMQDTATRLRIGGAMVATNGLLDVLLAGPLGVRGIALANSAGMLVGLVMGAVFLSRKTGYRLWRDEETLSFVGRAFLASLVAVTSSRLCFLLLQGDGGPASLGQRLVTLGGAGMAMAVVYLATSWLLGLRRPTWREEK